MTGDRRCGVCGRKKQFVTKIGPHGEPRGRYKCPASTLQHIKARIRNLRD